MVTTVGTHRIKFNNVDLFPYGSSTTDQVVDGYTMRWLSFKITVENGKALMEYGPNVWQMTTLTGNWNSPASVVVYNENWGHGGGMRVDNLKFGIVP